MRRRHPYAWRAWRDTIIAIAAVIAVGSLASAHPSLRAPRGPHESVVIVPTGATEAGGPAGTGPTGATEAGGPAGTGPEMEPAGEGGSPSDGVDFTACEGVTGLDNAICRHEALLAVHPDNHGLQTSLTRLLELRAEHEAKGPGGGGNGPQGHGSSSSSSHGHDPGHGQNGEPHGNAGGSGHGNEPGNAGGGAHVNGPANGH